MNLDVLQIIDDYLGMDDALTGIQPMREVLDGLAALLNDDLPEVGAFHSDIAYREVEAGSLTLDVIVPKGEGPFPVLVYLHGGGWVWGSPATHRKLTFRLAEQGFLTLSVDYRLAPEHPFPAGFNDCVHAIHFAAHNAGRWGGDSERLVLAGDSAGANLAAAAAIELADAVAAPRIRAVGLIYGVFDFSGLASDAVSRLLIDAYLGGEEELVADPRVSPIVKATKLPPAHIAVGSADPLIEDAERLHTALTRAGKTNDFHIYEDMPHAFMQMEFLSDATRGIYQMSEFLQRTGGKRR